MPSVLDKNAGKAFIHRTKIYCLVTKLYEVFNRLQAFLYFLLWGIKVGIERKHILHSWVADQSTAFLLAHGSHLNVYIAEELGRRVNKSENFNPRPTMTKIS